MLLPDPIRPAIVNPILTTFATVTLGVSPRRGFSSLVTSTAALIPTGWSEPVPGRVYPRLWTTAFSWRTGNATYLKPNASLRLVSWLSCLLLKTTGGPVTRFPLRSTFTSTRLAILMNGMPLFIPYSLRSKAIVPVTEPEPFPLPVIVNVNF